MLALPRLIPSHNFRLVPLEVLKRTSGVDVGLLPTKVVAGHSKNRIRIENPEALVIV
jgi:hypothetical protein